MKINDISENSPLCSGFVMTFTHSSRWIECTNTRKSIGNGFPMKKYVGALVRKPFQLVIAAAIDHFENRILVPKIIHMLGVLKKQNYIKVGWIFK